MKRTLALLLVGISTFLFSCQKEQTLNGNNIESGGPQSGRVDPGEESCEPFPFGVLALNGGSLTINSSRSLIADVGYSSGVTSNINQKIDQFTGGAYVHSQVNSFIYTAATYQPTEGIIRNNPYYDNLMDQYNLNAVGLSANFNDYPADYSFGAVTTNKTINSVGPTTVVKMASLDYNSNTLTLNGTVGGDDGFIINVTGNFDFSQSKMVLNNVRPERVIFNFPNPSSILINKASNIFKGTILAPTGNVIYHNPASFEGSIIARNIALHSDFNLTQRSYCAGQ